MIDMEEKIQPVYKREPEENSSKEIEKWTVKLAILLAYTFPSQNIGSGNNVLCFNIHVLKVEPCLDQKMNQICKLFSALQSGYLSAYEKINLWNYLKQYINP